MGTGAPIATVSVERRRVVDAAARVPATSTATARARPFRADIEGLRAVAILLVVAYHAGVPGFAGGYVGVDVFFVVSGYLITDILTREAEAAGRVSLVRFYARRARRLLPAVALVVVATLAAAAALASPLEVEDVAGAARWVAVYAVNVRFAAQATDYFAGDVEQSPLLHTWSLAVEEQFYLAWPLLLAAGAFVVRADRPRRAAFALAAGLAATCSFVVCVRLTATAQPSAFFLAPARAWEFAVGAAAALLVVQRARRTTALLSAVGVLMILAATVTFDEATAFPGPAAAVPVVGTVAVLVGGSSNHGCATLRALGTRPLQWLGRHSYSWYLWHWPVLTFAAFIWYPLRPGHAVVALGVALALSAATFAVVEDPVRRSRVLEARPAVTLALAVVLAAATFAAAAASARVAAAGGNDPAHVRAVAARADLPASQLAGCGGNYEDVAVKTQCVFGNRHSSTTAVLFGDSHAEQWFPAVEAVALERGWRLLVLVKAECPTADVVVFSPRLVRSYRECTQWRSAVLAHLEAVRPAVVVVSNSHAYVPRGRGESEFRVTADEWRAGQRRSVARLVRAGASAVLVADTPRPGFDVPVCLSRAATALVRRPCTFARHGALNEGARSQDAAALRGMERSRLVDLTASVCARETCEVERGGTVLYRDTNHLTARFARQLAPALGAAL